MMISDLIPVIKKATEKSFYLKPIALKRCLISIVK